jgi:hypothetical protein
MPSPSGTQWVTSDDVILLTLGNLGVTSTGQSIDPEDYQRVQNQVMPTFLKLAALEIAYVPQLDAIPGAWFADLAWILAGECAPLFGSATEDHIRFLTLGLGGPPSSVDIGAGAAAKSLKQQLRGRPTGEPVRTFYF